MPEAGKFLDAGLYMDLTDILRAVKEGKMDIKTAEKKTHGLGFVSYEDIAKLDSIEKAGQE